MINRSSKTNNWANGSNLAIVAVLLFVLGCGCPQKLKELSAKKQEPPTRSTPVSTSTPDIRETPSTAKKGDYDVTMDKYNKISIGTPRSEVEKILGGKGTEISSSVGGGVAFSVNKWEGEKYKSIILTFRDDKVMSKSQVGLK